MQSTIGVFFGGKSPEHDISIITGELVISGLRGAGYKVIPVYIDKTGAWFADQTLGDIKLFTSQDTSKRNNLDQWYVDLTKSRGKIVLRKKGIIGHELTIDIAFPAFHGSNGEDGTAQGMFEFFGIPFVGCDTESSAIAMDKVTTKLLYQALGIPTVPFVYFYHDEWEQNVSAVINQIENKLSFPLIVKPASLGSSIGISKTKNSKELTNALEVAFHYAERVIVEHAVTDLKDITCAVLGTHKPIASLLQESSYHKDFFSYEDKYLKGGGAQLGKASQAIIIPAKLDVPTTEKIRQMAVRIYRAFHCSGTSRIDFLYDTKAKKFYANEINTMPGTLYHHLWKKSGVELDELLKQLIDLALERHESKKSLTYTFESSVLSSLGSAKLSK